MTTPVIIDAVAVAVLAGFAILGAWKGLLRTLAGMLVLALSLAGAGIIASALSAPAAKLAAPVIEKRLESRLDEAIEERFSKEEREALEANSCAPLEEQMSAADLLELLGVDRVQWDALSFRALDTVQSTGVHLMTAVIESVAQSMLYGVLYMISFILLSAALHLLVRMLDAFLKLPGLHGLNAVGGGLAGLAEGALLLFLAVWALRLVGISFDGQEGSQVFRFFTAHTPLDALKFLGI